MNINKKVWAVILTVIVLTAAVVGRYVFLQTGSVSGNAIVRQLPQKEQKALEHTLNKVNNDAFAVILPTRLPYRVRNGRAMVTYVPQHPNTVIAVDVYFGNSPHELSIEESKGRVLHTTTQKVSLKNGEQAYFRKSPANSSLVWLHNGMRISIISQKINSKTNPPTSGPDLSKTQLTQIANSFR